MTGYVQICPCRQAVGVNAAVAYPSSSRRAFSPPVQRIVLLKLHVTRRQRRDLK